MTASLLAVLAGGCLPPQASYEFGLGTTRIDGSVVLAGEGEKSVRPGGDALVVIYKYHHTFIVLDDGGAIVRPTAHVALPDRDGGFSVSMPADVVAMELLFIAPDHLTDTFRFQRQLGLGKVTYRARLPRMRRWRDHFFTYLSPQLENLVVEKRYRLSPRDQKVLSDWLTGQQDRLESQRAKPAGREPPR